MHEAAQMFKMVDYVKKVTVKKFCKYVKYGLFEHSLFSFFFFFFFYVIASAMMKVVYITFAEQNMSLVGKDCSGD